MNGAPSQPPRVAVPWQELHRDCRTLAAGLASRPGWKGIIGVARGGLVPAAILARELNIRLVETVCIATYDETVRGQARILKSLSEQGEGWLLVDDLVDTGATAKILRDMIPAAYFVTLYAKPQGKPYVDAFVREIPQDIWIEFPWDLPA